MMYLSRSGIGVGRLHITWLDIWARTRWYGDDLAAHRPWYRGLGLWIEWGKR